MAKPQYSRPIVEFAETIHKFADPLDDDAPEDVKEFAAILLGVCAALALDDLPGLYDAIEEWVDRKNAERIGRN